MSVIVAMSVFVAAVSVVDVAVSVVVSVVVAAVKSSVVFIPAGGGRGRCRLVSPPRYLLPLTGILGDLDHCFLTANCCWTSGCWAVRC